RGARPVSSPRRAGGVVTATVGGFGDVTHTFVQRDSGVDGWALPDMVPVGPRYPETGGLTDVDHFAVCVESGQLDATVEFYERVLGFDLIFAEQVVIGAQAMTTKVVESTSRAVTLTIIEPDVSRVAGHIDEFLADHGGPGVQHIAFTVDDIVAAVESLSARGIGFLATPATYYAMLPERVRLARYTVDELRSHHILVDQDHDGQLYQIFTESVHPRNTIFMEVIERLGARSFGSGNIKALYQAVEAQRHRDDAAAA
ncbi:MAG: VOC family protein, partial [Actinophytocola sp.]|uniref:VOC family protein n=1 Tax=Actinophytocola sp. TaxID=1872138 RepID=UPI003D6B0D8B